MQRTLLIPLLIIILVGCGGTGTKNSPEASHDASGLSPECTQFLDGYEKYVDDYIQLLKDYKSNPTDLSLMQRATDMASEAQAWGGKAAPECKAIAEFMTRQVKIQAKLAQASLTL